MFKRVLVPLDGSALAERALVPASALARIGPGNLHLLSVVVPYAPFAAAEPAEPGHYGYFDGGPSVAEAEAKACDYLADVRRTRLLAGLPVRYDAFHGDVASVIVDTAAREKAELIAMSSHGYTGLTRWMLGSVAEKVLHNAPCPVLVVRASQPIRHILIPLDGSELAEQAVQPALALAAGLDAHVTLLRAVRTIHVEEQRMFDGAEVGLGQRLQEELREEALNYLRRVAAWYPEARCGVVPFARSVAESILDYAQAHAVDLVAMSTHGYTGLARWMYGSVTERVLRGSQFSMLVVRPTVVRLPEAAGTEISRHLSQTEASPRLQTVAELA